MRKTLSICGLGMFLARTAFGFTLIGPVASWQGTPVQMNLPGDIGTPQVIGEEYRYTVPVIYYAIDATFADYFGARGIEEVDKAIKMIDDLPKASSMSQDLSEFPVDTARLNYKAASLNLFDLKSTTLSLVLEQLGLLEPTRFTWCLRQFTPAQDCTTTGVADYLIIKRNYDPVTWEPTSYINGTLYTFTLILGPQCAYGDAVEQAVDPLATIANTLADKTLRFGRYFTGLTRDDIGGLRYLYRPTNINANESLPSATLVGGGGGGPWSIPDPTLAATTPPPALREGVDQVKFVKREYDSLLGNFFEPFTNTFEGLVITNGAAKTETYYRPVLRPDFIFSAADLGVNGNTFPVVATRINPPYQTGNLGTAVAGEINGPGSMDISQAQVGISFQKVGPSWAGQTPFLISETQTRFVWNWGSFDGSTNQPVIYPSYSSTRDLEKLIFGN